MKLKAVLIFTIVSIAILSCKREQISAEQNVIDLSSFGSVNMIKEIGVEIFVLNSTESSVYKLDGDSLSLFRDLDIGGRDFLLDFDIEGDKVYYSNTYDEIFVSSGNAIEDTINVPNPDRIEVKDSNLFVTSRKSEEGWFYIRSVNLETGAIVKKAAMNDEPVSGMKFSQSAIFEGLEGLFVLNTFRQRVELYDTDLNIVSFVGLPANYEFGIFWADYDRFLVLCSNDLGTGLISADRKTGDREFLKLSGEGSFDIKSSLVSNTKAYLYDFITGNILIVKFK
jgi:hypothetical protein